MATMIEYLRKKLELLIDDLLAPIWTWLSQRLKSLSWFARIMVVILLTIAYAVVVNWATIPSLASYAGRVIRVITEPTQIPSTERWHARLGKPRGAWLMACRGI
jgi:hypothetical protein